MIRQARADEIPHLVRMGERFHRESGYHEHIAHNPAQMALLGHQLVNTGTLLVSEREGQVVGMIGYVLFPHFMSGEMVSGEVFWWVEPEYRGEGIKLLKEAEKRSKAAGAVKMQMIAPNDRVASVYKRVGYGFVEAAYQRTL